MAVMCVPMPPCFFGLPLRQMMLPLRGPLPVNSQMRAINFVQLRDPKHSHKMPDGKHYFREKLPVPFGAMPENGLGFPGQFPLSLARMNVNPFRRSPVKILLLALNLLLPLTAFPLPRMRQTPLPRVRPP